MAIQLKKTNDYHLNGVKILVYGAAGAGKTCLIPTLDNPLIISAEGGLLSINNTDLDYIEIKTFDDLKEAYHYVLKCEHKTIAIDSISEIAETVLNNEKQVNKDGRAAYGSMQDIMTSLIRSFRDIKGKNIYMSAKMEKSQNEHGQMLYMPSMPGNKMSQSLPYFFDEVFALRAEKDPEGNIVRILQTQPDGFYDAKDRSGKLDQWEQPNLLNIIKKIGG